LHKKGAKKGDAEMNGLCTPLIKSYRVGVWIWTDAVSGGGGLEPPLQANADPVEMIPMVKTTATVAMIFRIFIDISFQSVIIDDNSYLRSM
jgi:hypothetical protein